MKTTHQRYHSLVAVSTVLAVLAGCFNSPTWRWDHYEVRGAIRGSDCDVRVDGRPSFHESSESVSVMIDYAYNIGLPPNIGLKTIFCGGFQVSIASAVGLLPAPGVYRVVPAPAYDLGTASVGLLSKLVTAGAWPLAMTGVMLEAYDGRVQIDSLRPPSVWAQVFVHSRRQHRGE